jgi:dienelactone hydrolase
LHHDFSGQMWADLQQRAQKDAFAQAMRKAGLQSAEAFEKHRDEIRAHLLEAIGGLPVEKTPLNVRLIGVIEQTDCTIEKILFESQPNYLVSALCYVPRELNAPAPAVLFLCGHCEEGKAHADYQQVCRDLVANGFVVLVIEPFGQGERLHYLCEGKSIHDSDTVEHSFAGLQFMLQGANVARHFVWDAIRAVDYLTERGDVDAWRIGATGNSGGGLQTALLMALEPRLAAAVPCTWITSLEHMMRTGYAQDMEQIIHGAIKRGPDHDDYLAAMAPRPVLLGAAAYDSFPVEGSIQSFERARAVYALYGEAEKVEIVIDPAPHCYSPGLRQASVNWFKRHLKNEDPDFVTSDSPVLELAELQVTRSGQILGDYPEIRTIFDLNRELLEAKPALPPRTVSELRAELADFLGINGAGSRDERIYPRVWPREHEGRSVEDTWFFSSPRVAVGGALFIPSGRPVGTVLLVADNGTVDLPEHADLVEGLLSEGKAVFAFDPRGIGGVRMRAISASEAYRPDERADEFAREYPFFTTAYKMACDEMMLGGSTLGFRVFDILRAFDYLQQRDPGIPVELYGVGRGATWGYFAAVLGERIISITCVEMLASYRQLCRTRFYDASRFNLDIAAWGLLNCGDMEDFRPCFEARSLTLIRPVYPLISH